MKLQLLRAGAKFSIYAIELTQGSRSECPALSFIDRMAQDSRKSMLAVLKLHAEAGPILNKEKSRKLTDEIYEFKSRQGDRLLYFYAPDRRGVTIVTHGFHKGALLEAEIERAGQIREQYLRQKGANHDRRTR